MICPRCNYLNQGDSKFCQNCGALLPQTPNVPNNRNNGSGGMSIASMVLGIVGFVFTFIVIGIVPSLIGLVLGIIALATKKPKKGMAIAGVILSALSLLLFIGVVVSINSDDIPQENEVVESTEDVESEQSVQPDEQSDTPIIEEEVSDGIKPGGSFENDGLKITVNSANLDFQDYDNEYGWNTPENGMKYIMVSFTFENIGDSDEYVSIYDFNCYADNAVCEQVYGLDDSNFINANLSPERNVSFNTYYTVPINSQSIELEYETSSWTGEKVTIILQ